MERKNISLHAFCRTLCYLISHFVLTVQTSLLFTEGVADAGFSLSVVGGGRSLDLVMAKLQRVLKGSAEAGDLEKKPEAW